MHCKPNSTLSPVRSLILLLGFLGSSLLFGQTFEGKKSSFHGFEQIDFKHDNASLRVVRPKQVAEGKPWIIRARFWGHEPQTDKALLNLGWHVAYADISGLFGNAEAVRRWDVLYDLLTTKHGFNKQVGIEAMSRGGLIAYAWAAKHPERVRGIYADAPVIDIRSWPKGEWAGKGSAGTWKQCLEQLKLTEDTLDQWSGPLDNLKPLADAGVPLLHVIGIADDVVPPSENTDRLQLAYEKLGGSIEVICKPACGHHPHSLKDPGPIVDFFLGLDTRGVEVFARRPIPAGVALKGHGKDATVYGYRIPSLLVSKQGTVLAFSERRLGLHDHAQNDIVLKRSSDGGATFGEEIVVFEDGMHSINDPLSVQLEDGRILLMFARFPYGRHARASGWIKAAELGFDNPNLHVLTYLTESRDDGRTWSTPVDITRQVKAPNLINANTPGAMIQIQRGPHQGRIVTGLWGTVPPAAGSKSRTWQVVSAWSDDGGKTWSRSAPLVDKSGKGFPNECQVAEAANGELVLIARNQGGATFRKKVFSKDGGESWSEVEVDETLPSVACMGSLIRGPERRGTWDLFASFPSDQGRKDGQIRRSRDHGKTWQRVHTIPGAFAYSCLQVAPDGQSLLLLYEAGGYQSERLLRLPVDAFVE